MKRKIDLKYNLKYNLHPHRLIKLQPECRIIFLCYLIKTNFIAEVIVVFQRVI